MIYSLPLLDIGSRVLFLRVVLESTVKLPGLSEDGLHPQVLGLELPGNGEINFITTGVRGPGVIIPDIDISWNTRMLFI